MQPVFTAVRPRCPGFKAQRINFDGRAFKIQAVLFLMELKEFIPDDDYTASI
jgi:hypothetical protein